MKFSDLAKATKRSKVSVGDDEISFAFRHGLITPRFIQDLLALDESRLKNATPAEADAALASVSEQMARIVAEWDVTEEDGVTMFPLVADRLAAEIPLSVQVAILFTCMAEMQPGEATAPGSKAEISSMTSKRSGATS
jgi:hypothetical protein